MGEGIMNEKIREILAYTRDLYDLSTSYPQGVNMGWGGGFLAFCSQKRGVQDIFHNIPGLIWRKIVDKFH